MSHRPVAGGIVTSKVGRALGQVHKEGAVDKVTRGLKALQLGK